MRALLEQIEELDENEVYGRVIGVRGLMVEVAGPLHAMSVAPALSSRRRPRAGSCRSRARWWVFPAVMLC